MKKTTIAIATLLGTMVGAGILGIPYMVKQSGFTIGLIHLILIGLIITITMLYLGEIILRTKSTHHVTGYAAKYLGKKGKSIMFLSTALGIYAALLAYLLGEGESWSQLFTGTSHYSLVFSLAFWGIFAGITYFGISALKKGETWGVLAIITLLLILSIQFIPQIQKENLEYTNVKNIFVPFGVILFAYLAFSAMPEVRNILRHQEKSMKKVIILAHVIVFVIYILFTILVLGSQGQATPQLATLGLGKTFILLGVLTMFTSYLALASAITDTLYFDFQMHRKKAWIITSILPLCLLMLIQFTKNTSFTTVLSVGGVISGGLTAILILFMVRKAKVIGNRKPEYQIPCPSWLMVLLILVFTSGAIVEIVRILK